MVKTTQILEPLGSHVAAVTEKDIIKRQSFGTLYPLLFPLPVLFLFPAFVLLFYPSTSV